MPDDPGKEAGAIRASVTSFSQNCPPRTKKKLLNWAPSSDNDLECGGIDPGVIPPMSA